MDGSRARQHRLADRVALPLRALRPRLGLAWGQAAEALRAVQGLRLGEAGEVEAGAAEEMSACAWSGERPTAALGLGIGAKRLARSGERPEPGREGWRCASG